LTPAQREQRFAIPKSNSPKIAQREAKKTTNFRLMRKVFPLLLRNLRTQSFDAKLANGFKRKFSLKKSSFL